MVTGAIFVAVWVTNDRRWRIVVVSSLVGEEVLHWRIFLQERSKLGLHKGEIVNSDYNQRLRVALASCFPGVSWNRCQCSLQWSTRVDVPKSWLHIEIAGDILMIFLASNR